MRTLALTVAYDGTDWAGMQRLRTAPTIQGTLEAALSQVLQHPVRIAVAGRTDAGVHALGQVISLHSANPIPVERLPRVVNRLLPSTIKVRRAMECLPGFHARHTACWRRYWYVLQVTRQPDPLRGRFCWQIAQPVAVEAMQAALIPLLGCHDFRALCHSGPPVHGNTVRTLQRAHVTVRRNTVIIEVQADAFLQQMIRLLVANLVEIGHGERPVCWLEELLHTRNRHLAGKGAPPHGLILMRIGYPPVARSSPQGRLVEIE